MFVEIRGRIGARFDIAAARNKLTKSLIKKTLRQGRQGKPHEQQQSDDEWLFFRRVGSISGFE
jgi:hypothetical protein